MKKHLALATGLTALLLASTSAQAVLMRITLNLDGVKSSPMVGSAAFKSLPQRKLHASAKALGGETLQGTLAGEWDQVFGAVVYPGGFADEPGEFFFVGMALPASATAPGQYDVPGWHREGFFLDAGDGVPRLVAAALLDPAFVPEAGGAHSVAGQLWVSQHVLYQEIEELQRNPDFYASYPQGAINADFSFVTDDEGQVLELLVDIYDEFDQYLYSVRPQPGDLYNPGSTAYELSQPDFVFIGYFFDQLQPFGDDVSLVRDHIVPSAESDPTLPEGVDTADLEVFLILEGGRETTDGDAEFAYGDLIPLGYTWGEAKTLLEGDVGAEPDAGGSGGSGTTGLPLLMALLGLGRARRRWDGAQRH
ncbi:MAG: hypothetical protein ABF296_10275 [Oceanococcaceae bacterium]